VSVVFFVAVAIDILNLFEMKKNKIGKNEMQRPFACQMLSIANASISKLKPLR
jgi:hypothetical protein